MAVTKASYTGDGSTVLFSIPFPYISESDIVVLVNNVVSSAFTFANPTTVEFNTAPGVGISIEIIRQTDSSDLRAVLSVGSSLRASDLNNNFVQGLYISQETINVSQAASSSSQSAISIANVADGKADQAISNSAAAVNTANTASGNATNATNTANNASANANAAVNTANSAASAASAAVNTANAASNLATQADANATQALSTANQADADATLALSTANQADSDATQALSTANQALNDAGNAISTANQADNNASAAVITANAAASAVASAILFVPVADLTALLALTPADGDFYELNDSTGAESEPSIVGLPVGLVGDPGLTFRLTYSDPPGEFVFLSYFANNPEDRYANVVDGATGAGPDKVFLQNDQVVTTSYTIPTGKNASSTGTIEVSVGTDVTISANSTWVIL